MSIILRKVNQQTFVSETRRIDGKVVQQYLGTYSDPALRMLYRTAQLQVATRNRDRADTKQTRRDCSDIENALSVIDAVVARLPVLRRLLDLETVPMQPRDRAGQSFPFDRMLKLVEHIPVMRAFRRLSRASRKGDAKAAETLIKACEASQELLASFADFAGMAKWMVAKQFSHGDQVFAQSIRQKAERLQVALASRVEDDPLLEMTAELVVIAYVDAARSALLAAHRYDTKTETEYFQRLADRSAARYQRLAQVFQDTAAQGKQSSEKAK